MGVDIEHEEEEEEEEEEEGCKGISTLCCPSIIPPPAPAPAEFIWVVVVEKHLGANGGVDGVHCAKGRSCSCRRDRGFRRGIPRVANLEQAIFRGSWQPVPVAVKLLRTASSTTILSSRSSRAIAMAGFTTRSSRQEIPRL